MRPDRLYLLDIIEAADRVDVHLAERDRERFLADVTRQAAVLHELTVIGEAASRLSESLRQVHPATELVPDLRRQVASVLKAEFPEPRHPIGPALRLLTSSKYFSN